MSSKMSGRDGSRPIVAQSGSAGVPRDDDNASGDQRASVRTRAPRNVRRTMASEPIDTSADPALGAERGEAFKLAVLLLLERLSPTERAAYMLREAFNYSYKEIAEASTLKRPTRVSSPPARASMSRTDGGHASAAKSRNASSRRSLPRRRPANVPETGAPVRLGRRVPGGWRRIHSGGAEAGHRPRAGRKVHRDDRPMGMERPHHRCDSGQRTGVRAPIAGRRCCNARHHRGLAGKVSIRSCG